MTGDLISRKAAMQLARNHIGHTIDINDIARLPSVDAVPVVHGRWIYDINAQDWGIGGFKCSVCDAVNQNLPVVEKIRVSWFVGSKYCPNRGADMRGEEEHGPEE